MSQTMNQPTRASMVKFLCGEGVHQRAREYLRSLGYGGNVQLASLPDHDIRLVAEALGWAPMIGGAA